MSDVPTIFAALAAVAAEVTSVGKEGHHEQGGYAYRGLDSVLVAVGPALRRHRVLLVPAVESVEYSTVEIGSKNTRMQCCRMVTAFRWTGPAGDVIESKIASEGMDVGDKAASKAASVAYRTAILQTLSIPTVNSAGITPGQVRAVQTLFGLAGLGGKDRRDDRLDYASVLLDRPLESVTDLTVSEAGLLIDALQMTVDEPVGHEAVPA